MTSSVCYNSIKNYLAILSQTHPPVDVTENKWGKASDFPKLQSAKHPWPLKSTVVKQLL